MNRRELFSSVGTGIAAAGFMNLTEPALAAQHRHAEVTQKLHACADLCNVCADACLTKLAQGTKEVGASARSCTDCASVCALTAQLVARRSPFGIAALKFCMDVCIKCAETCEKTTECEECNPCAKLCRECADACKRAAM